MKIKSILWSAVKQMYSLHFNVRVIRIISIVKLLNFIKGLQGVGIWGTMQIQDKTAQSEHFKNTRLLQKNVFD